jgi:hypothetical protein
MDALDRITLLQADAKTILNDDEVSEGEEHEESTYLKCPSEEQT